MVRGKMSSLELLTTALWRRGRHCPRLHDALQPRGVARFPYYGVELISRSTGSCRSTEMESAPTDTTIAQFSAKARNAAVKGS